MKTGRRKRWMRGIFVLSMLLGNTAMNAQQFANSPVNILKNWDYYKLVEELGDGQPIIDTMAGQAYISGMRYQEQWLNRDAEVSYYFSDIDIASFRIRFWSPYLSQRTKGRIEMNMNPAARDSIFRVIRYQDSVRNDSLNRLLKADPDFIFELKDRAEKINQENRRLYDLDSLRCDTIIMDMSAVMGQPYDQNMTLHTEALARFYALWINHGLAVSLKDYTDYTDISFSIPVVTKEKAQAFGLDEHLEIYYKTKLPVEQDTLDVTLLCLPDNQPDQYTEAVLMLEPSFGPTFSEKLIEDNSFVLPKVSFPDLNQDNQPECWFQALFAADTSCGLHQFFLLESNEPITIFNSQVDLEQMTEGRLLNAYQADLTLSDGTRFAFPLEAGKLPDGLYDRSGKLLSDDMLITGCLHRASMIEKENGLHLVESQSDLQTFPGKIKLGEIRITWRFFRGYWSAEDFEFIQH